MKNRPFGRKSVHELEQLATLTWDVQPWLQTLKDELKFRKTPWAQRLRLRVQERLRKVAGVFRKGEQLTFVLDAYAVWTSEVGSEGRAQTLWTDAEELLGRMVSVSALSAGGR